MRNVQDIIFREKRILLYLVDFFSKQQPLYLQKDTEKIYSYDMVSPYRKIVRTFSVNDTRIDGMWRT